VASKTEFSGDQYAEAYPPGVEDTYWHIGRNRIIMRQIQAANGSKVLDVGCGRGILVNYLVEHGADC
jgi:2-polyprenyl-3-methyl-5-hydroxy-6-metoxy-1,4-benzoquinol methylase